MVDASGEFVFTCTNMYVPEGAELEITCGRFTKFPADIDPQTFADSLKKHEEANVGQVSLAAQETKLDNMLEALGAEEINTPEMPENDVVEEATPQVEEVVNPEPEVVNEVVNNEATPEVTTPEA